jgi:oligosaccharide repeat unit polymerase
MRWLAPTTLLAICWGITFLIAGLALALPQVFDLVPLFLFREALDIRAFTWSGAVWLLIGLIALVTGDLAARVSLPTPARLRNTLNLNRTARLNAHTNTIFLGVTLIWVSLTAQQEGGIGALIRLTTEDTLGARDALLDNKLFTGMRLFYAALPATGCLAAAILAAGGRSLSKRARRRCQRVLLFNTAALFLLPIVMSQRLLLLQFVLSAYLVTCLINRRVLGLKWLGLGTVLFLCVWVFREHLTNPHLDRSALDVGGQKLAFYFVNDLWNSFAPLHVDNPPTLGAHTLHGVMVLSFTDGYFDPLLAERIWASDQVRGGGEFSLLTAPYVDFGLVGGALFLVCAGFVFRLSFHRAHGSVLASVIFAQVGAALLFSSHGIYVTHQNCLFSFLVILVICRMSGYQNLSCTGQRSQAPPTLHPIT